jgi:putative methionine-R-sulfoxide reductase with GAF domain
MARALHVKNGELQPTLDAIVSTAVNALSPARHAGLIIVSHGNLVPQATTGAPPQRLDRLQQKLGDGPCVDAAKRQTVIRIEDTCADRRWPDFCAAALDLGVRSMLCVPLRVDERCLGTLSLFAEDPSAFDDHHEQITTLLATLAALALADAQRADQLHTALRNRDVIGQAKGILMERHRITAEVAFGYLSQASQAVNMKLTGVALHLVDTGELLGAGASQAGGSVTPRPGDGAGATRTVPWLPETQHRAGGAEFEAGLEQGRAEGRVQRAGGGPGQREDDAVDLDVMPARMDPGVGQAQPEQRHPDLRVT